MGEQYIDYFPRTTELIVTPALSTFSTILALLLSLITKSFRDPLGEIITWINFMDLLHCLPKILPLFFRIRSLENCLVLEGVTHFGIISSILWITFFGYALLVYTRSQHMDAVAQKLCYFRVIGILIPMIFAFSASFFGNFIEYKHATDHSTATCVHLIIPGDFNYSYFVFRFLPITLSIIVSLGIYIKVILSLRSTQEVKSANTTLLIYPAVCFVCWTPSLTINMIQVTSSIMTESIVLIQIFRALSQLQGFFDVILYRGVLACLCNQGYKLFGRLTDQQRHHTSLLDIWNTVVQDRAKSDITRSHDRGYTRIGQIDQSTKMERRSRSSRHSSSYPSEESL